MTELSSPERKQTIQNPLLIFGIGPIVDKQYRMTASSIFTVPGEEDITFWSRNLAKAAAVLNAQSPEPYTFFVSGGRTGGEKYMSEAEGIAREMQANGIGDESVNLDNKAKDTVENIINILNAVEGPENKPDELEMSLLSTSFMAHRVKTFTKVFGIKIKDAFVGEEVLRHEARLGDDQKKMQEIEDMLDVNDPQKYYDKQKGVERRDIFERNLHDNLWVRQMLEYPQRILHPAAEIKNDARLKEVVRRLFVIHGDEEIKKFGIDLAMDANTLRTKLREVQWPFLTEKEFTAEVKKWEQENQSSQGWPVRIMEKYDRLMSF